MPLPFVFRAFPALCAAGVFTLWAFACSDSIRVMVEQFFGSLGAASPIKDHSNIWGFFEIWLSVHILFLHLLAAGFPIRNIYAVVIMTYEVAQCRILCKRRRKELQFSESDDIGVNSVIHAIMMPNYKEDIDTLRDTLDVLASADMAKTNMDIYLAKEERDAGAKASAAELEAVYEGAFRNIRSTFHPVGIPGEAAGKSSNVSWAAKQAVRDYEEEGITKDVIFTVIDSDTHLSPDYFMLVSEMHAASLPEEKDISYYVPPVIFDRNSTKVPLMVRLADLVWSAASLSGTYPGSSVCIPTAVYSVPMQLVKAVGGWDTGPEAIGEDLHNFLKCFFYTRGKLMTRPVPSAASHCNVSSPKQGFRGYIDGMVARWQQGMRHMWGALDSGYSYQRLIPLLRGTDPASNGDKTPLSLPTLFRVTLLYLRLFEAHCLPVQLVSCLIGSAIFEAFIPPVITPTPMRLTFFVCGIIRALCFVLMVVYFTLYRRYHAVCLRIRMEDAIAAGLGSRAAFSAGTPGLWYWIEACCFPVSGILFGSIPAFYAQFMQLFTDKLVYVVSLKPIAAKISQRNIAIE